MRRSSYGFARLVEAIDKPLGFYVLALLIVEGLLTTLLIFSNVEPYAQVWGLWVVTGLFILVFATVSLFVWYKPTHLTFTGFEALVGMGKASYGTDEEEVAQRALPGGTAAPD